MGAPRSGWLELLWVAGPGGLLGVGAYPIGAGGRGLGMCGDIHPNPGPLRTVVANVTSLRLHAVEVASWEVDVIFLQETKLSRGGGGGQKATCHFFAKRGWQCFWGCPLDTKGRGYVEHPPRRGRGPGAKGPHRAADEAPPHARLRPPGVGPLALHPWVQVRVALGDGATVLHTVSVYGVVGDRESN